MNQLQKYTWLIDTICRAGEISHKALSQRWARNEELSDGKPLHRATFNRWRDAICDQFGIIISCQRVGGYLYYIENPEEIEEDRLKKWMLDSYAVGNMIGENLALKDRIMVDEIPSGREHLTTLLEAMKDNRVTDIVYRPFGFSHGYKFPIEPYGVKLFENRWYVVAHNIDYDQMRIYSLDRIDEISLTDRHFKLAEGFTVNDYFSEYYGIVADKHVDAVRIVLRADKSHKHYMKSLPLHHSQRLMEECDEYADFELYLAPTYDLVMKLLQAGAKIEVISPARLREEMKRQITKMLSIYD